jgi:hypothetical protein
VNQERFAESKKIECKLDTIYLSHVVVHFVELVSFLFRDEQYPDSSDMLSFQITIDPSILDETHAGMIESVRYVVLL